MATEEAPAAEAPTARGLLRDGVSELTGWDGRLLATLRDLAARPSAVAAAYLSGDRQKYTPPVRAFFLLGGLYMLCFSCVRPFEVPPDEGGHLTRLFERFDVTWEQAAQRLESRLNAALPLVSGLCLLPVAATLRLLAPERPFREHLLVLLTFTNAIWLVSLLLLPAAFASPSAYFLLLQVVSVGYFCRLVARWAPGRSGLRTASRVAALWAVDVTVSLTVTILLYVVVFVSVLLV